MLYRCDRTDTKVVQKNWLETLSNRNVVKII